MHNPLTFEGFESDISRLSKVKSNDTVEIGMNYFILISITCLNFTHFQSYPHVPKFCTTARGLTQTQPICFAYTNAQRTTNNETPPMKDHGGVFNHWHLSAALQH